jgi:nucleoside-diphosphate-sugar epimerase
MRVLVAGATGVLGRPLVPLLTSVGHTVVALGRPDGRTAQVQAPGVTAELVDPFDRAAIMQAVRRSAPDAVVHLMTAIPAQLNPRRMATQFALTNRLRAETTRHLVDAAAAVGASRVITQGVAFAYDPTAGTSGEPANEDVPLWREPPREFAGALDALRTLEACTRDAGGLVLRFGHLYGPGSAFGHNGAFTEMIRAGKLPLVGKGTATFSFLHADDAASAIVAALDRDVSGVLNIVDDVPVTTGVWVPALARMLGAPKPKRVPAFAARLVTGSWGAAFMTQLRGADNARAKLRLDWHPRYASWETGFAKELQHG